MSRFPSTSLRSSREVRLLGADVRFAVNDEEPVDRGPITHGAELSEEEAAIAFDLARNEQKNERWHRRNDEAAMALQLQHFRETGLL